MRTYRINVSSAFEGGRDHLDTEVSLPTDGELAYALGTRYPSAQQLADYYAAEYCDSGTVSVVNTRDQMDRGIVGRVSLPS